MKTSKVLFLLASLCFAATLGTSAQADGFYFNGNSKHGSTAVRHTSTVAADLGKFTWIDENASVNHIVVSLADQSLYAYNGTELVAYSNISSGKPGHETLPAHSRSRRRTSIITRTFTRTRRCLSTCA